MTDATLSPEDEDRALVGEFVLRLLSFEEAQTLRARMDKEPHLVALAADWEGYFAGLTEDVKAVEPRAALKQALLDRVFDDPQPQPRSGWFSGAIWAGLGLAAVIVAAALFMAVPRLSGPAPDYMAELVAEDVSVTASYFQSTQEVVVRVTDGSAPTGRVLQVWGIVERQGPVSIGVIPASGEARFSVPDALKGRFAGLICAISEEPPGGSPSGAPTGTILATAELRAL